MTQAPTAEEEARRIAEGIVAELRTILKPWVDFFGHEEWISARIASALRSRETATAEAVKAEREKCATFVEQLGWPAVPLYERITHDILRAVASAIRSRPLPEVK